MKVVTKLLVAVAAIAIAAPLASVYAKFEPWSQIEARTKFLRTQHHIEVVRIHTDVYKSARAKGGKVDPSPFPVHVILPKDYDTDVNRRYGVVYLLGGKSGWDNGPEKGGATYWSVWCKTPLTLDHLKTGSVTKVDFQDNISDDELAMFNRWLQEEPYQDLIVVALWNPGGGNTSRYEKYLIDEVIPFIDAHYRTVPNRLFRGIDGACAGAAQAVMISAKWPRIFAYAGGQQTDLGSYPGTHGVWRRYISRIRDAGGIAYNFNTNVKDGCNSYSNGGRLYRMVEDMKHNGFPVSVHVFKSCRHGYSAYRYPNGHQALYWFSRQFTRNARRLGINQDLPQEKVVSTAEKAMSAQKPPGRLPGLW
jgi:Putative esterase